MLTPKRIFPAHYVTIKNSVVLQPSNHPFYIKEYGYCNEKKLIVGEENNYNEILILYSISGIARFSRNKETAYINPNTAVISACNSPLIFNKVSKSWEFFYVIISGSHAKLYYNLIRDKSNIIPMNPLAYNVLDWFIAIAHTKLDSSVSSQMSASLLAHNILYGLYQTSYDIIQSKNIIPAQETDINIALNYIAKNYKEDLSIDTICKQVHLSKYYFCKIFKQHTDISIHQYVNEYRINKSKELLSYSKMSIKAIAASVGFNSALTYIRCFENSTHMTPSEYRENF
jgi:AraC-like DNA-binding protein